MKPGLLIVVFFMFIGFSLRAQRDFKPGYVILNNQDTVFGQIDYRGEKLMSSLCKFKSKDSLSVKNYLPGEISGYRFIDGKYFVSKEINSNFALKKTVFLEYLVKGAISFYFYRDDSGDHYFIEKQGESIADLPYDEGIKYDKDHSLYAFNSTRHVGILKYNLKEAPDLFGSIERIKKPEKNTLIELSKKYQSEVCKNENCIVYEKKRSKFKWAIEPIYSYESFNITSSDRLDFNETGMNLFIWLPETNEKLYLKTGLLMGIAHEIHLLKFPLQLQYVYPSVKFRPVLNGGFNIYSAQDSYVRDIFFSWHAGVGFLYKIYNKVSLSTSMNAEFAPPVFSLTDFLLFLQHGSYSIEIGLHIEL